MGFVTGMLAALDRRHVDPQALLAALDIDISDITSRIPIERYATLYNRLNHQLDDEGFGLFAQPMRIGSFEFLCRASISAPSLAEALTRASRFLHIVLPDLAVSVRRAHGKAELVIAETRKLAEQPRRPRPHLRLRMAAAAAARAFLLAGRARHWPRQCNFPLPEAGTFRRLPADFH